ncbi:hypothetical protein E3N88_32263 [Mikania micrantha]|uniref:Pyruvate kinase n=1 Tax=Mikania micrantha TaxID=192012 RepID=A0A5N6M805_9ASTR|nr:hypothetical protein E3N88_32263 [Mikania micrantha]
MLPSSGFEKLEALSAGGMDRARINMCHGTRDWHDAVFQKVRSLNRRNGVLLLSLLTPNEVRFIWGILVVLHRQNLRSSAIGLFVCLFHIETLLQFKAKEDNLHEKNKELGTQSATGRMRRKSM